MSNITIYHNPACGTSRNTLEMIRNSGNEPTVIHYLENPPSRDELVKLIADKRFALWQGADNLQNIRFPDLGIPCPFMLTWTTELEEQTKSQSEAFRKDTDLSKKANSAYAALFPGTKRAAEEWRRTREQLNNNEIALCNTYFNLTLFAPDNNTDAQACELAAVNVFRKNELEMVTIQYQQMRNWLAGFPFVMQEGMWEDLKTTGATLRAKSWNAVSLMPVVAERQLSNVGMPLPTYRNQVAFYDMFGEENGSTNFNIAVTGTSGAGKSFLTQGILRDVLNAGGYAWVIDMGDSYKNYCHQAGGVYLDGAKLRFNPFANVKDIKHSAEGIVRLLTVLASPTQPLDGVCEAILQKAVMDAWEKKANKARIDDVHNYLTNEDVNQAFADKPTIIARLAELAMLLDTYCTWGPDGEYFNADTPTLDGETRFAVLELLSLEDKPKLLSAILFSLILAIQEKMYHSPRDLKKVCIIDEAWRLLGGSNPHAARFIETGYPVVRLKLKYRPFKKRHAGLIERNIRDALSPELERVIQENERAAAIAGLTFPTGDEVLEKGSETSSADDGPAPVSSAGASGSQATPVVEKVARTRMEEPKPSRSAAPERKPVPVREPDISRKEPAVTENHRPVTAPVTGDKKDNVVSLRPSKPAPNHQKGTASLNPEIPAALQKIRSRTQLDIPSEPAAAGALGMLKRRLSTGATSDGGEDQASENAGESMNLDMKVTALPDGGLSLTTAGKSVTPQRQHGDGT